MSVQDEAMRVRAGRTRGRAGRTSVRDDVRPVVPGSRAIQDDDVRSGVVRSDVVDGREIETPGNGLPDFDPEPRIGSDHEPLGSSSEYPIEHTGDVGATSNVPAEASVDQRGTWSTVAGLVETLSARGGRDATGLTSSVWSRTGDLLGHPRVGVNTVRGDRTPIAVDHDELDPRPAGRYG